MCGQSMGWSLFSQPAHTFYLLFSLVAFTRPRVGMPLGKSRLAIARKKKKALLASESRIALNEVAPTVGY